MRRELTQRAENHPSPGTGQPVAEVSDDEAQQVPSEVVSSPTNNLFWSPRARGDLVRQHDEKCENLSEDFQQAKVGADTGFKRNVSEGRHFMTAPNAHVKITALQACVVNTRSLVMTNELIRRDSFEEIPKLVLCGRTGPIIFGHHAIEILIDSLGENGTQS